MLDFGLLPPEVNSGRMYSGPGPGPLLAASEAWDDLAAELGFAASGYGAALTELTSNSWVGPTSTAMTAAVTPYIDWLTSTGAQAEETANHARAAVAAYEAAFAMTVPPPAIAANRALLAALVATNFLGQKVPRDHDDRSPVRRNVGAGRRGHVRLRRLLAGCRAGDAVRGTPADDQP